MPPRDRDARGVVDGSFDAQCAPGVAIFGDDEARRLVAFVIQTDGSPHVQRDGTFFEHVRQQRAAFQRGIHRNNAPQQDGHGRARHERRFSLVVAEAEGNAETRAFHVAPRHGVVDARARHGRVLSQRRHDEEPGVHHRRRRRCCASEGLGDFEGGLRRDVRRGGRDLEAGVAETKGLAGVGPVWPVLADRQHVEVSSDVFESQEKRRAAVQRRQGRRARGDDGARFGPPGRRVGGGPLAAPDEARALAVGVREAHEAVARAGAERRRRVVQLQNVCHGVRVVRRQVRRDERRLRAGAHDEAGLPRGEQFRPHQVLCVRRRRLVAVAVVEAQVFAGAARE
mmetsp:Transcript_11510/g.34431  ORF Transcript_11510/g.34431 Transcript_11510/m.34431 type:complete len:340 (-) Transcript_11510:61-1080(-)